MVFAESFSERTEKGDVSTSMIWELSAVERGLPSFLGTLYKSSERTVLNKLFSISLIDRMTVLRKDLRKAAEEVAKEWGFSSLDEFINQAVEERIIELKKHEFKERSDKIKEGLEKKSISEQDILDDFEKKRSSA